MKRPEPPRHSRGLQGWIFFILAAGLLTPSAPRAAAASNPPLIHIRADRSSVGMGASVIISARMRNCTGRQWGGRELQPYVDGKRWGAAATTDVNGLAELIVPLPRPGIASITVTSRSPVAAAPGCWIWASHTSDGQIVYFRKKLVLRSAPTRAVLHITCDDAFEAYINGRHVASGSDFHHVHEVTGVGRWLRKGQNVIEVVARNGTGPAGLLALIEIRTREGVRIVASDASWSIFQGAAGWPDLETTEGSSPATVIAKPGGGPWGASIVGWPGLERRTDFPVGLPLPSEGQKSNTERVAVRKRLFHVKRDPAHRVGMEWEPWFTPGNAHWDTAEAVPTVGNYDSFNRDVIRQHCLWLVDAGIDFLLVDWSNNLWDKKHWSERSPGVDELIRATTAMLDTYSEMRKEGVPTPQVTLLLGLDNGPTTTPQALDEEMRWIYDHYVTNPRYAGLWLMDDDKPLIVPFDGGGQASTANPPLPLDSRFTVRWMGSQLQASHLERRGYWSWMDGVVHPIATMRDGMPEALTVTPAFFGDGGWTFPQAMGRRGGSTYVEEFNTALTVRPKFLIINQWNEFAGQPDGGGYGPKQDQYVDTYNVPLSDDIEPTSLTGCGYRGCGGWGFYYLNLTRALIDLYRSPRSEYTVLAMAAPERGASVTGNRLTVQWTTAGARPVSYTISIDGKIAARGVRSSPVSINISGLKPGLHSLVLHASGMRSPLSLSWTHEASETPPHPDAAAEASFFKR